MLPFGDILISDRRVLYSFLTSYGVQVLALYRLNICARLASFDAISFLQCGLLQMNSVLAIVW